MTSCIYDDKSQKLLDELFALLEQVAPESPNGVRTLWLRAERGPIEDFGNAAEEIAEGNYDSEEEFVNAWKSWFPEDVISKPSRTSQRDIALSHFVTAM